MKVKRLQVRDIYGKIFPDVTKKLTGIQLKEVPAKELKLIKPWYIYIRSKGKFRSVLICSMEKGLKETLIYNMSNGKELTEEVKYLYIGEYMNVACGHALTCINNINGSSSMLTVPDVLIDPLIFIKEGNFLIQEEFCFESQYGFMKIDLQYEMEE